MKQELRVITAGKGNKFKASMLDLLVCAAAIVALYFAILYGIFGTAFNYFGNEKTQNEIFHKYELDLPSGLTYDKYESAIQNFYFTYYPEQTLKSVQSIYPSIVTITHAYNVTVLQLPVNPTSASYSSDFYEYYQNSDGTFDVNRLGIKKSGKSGDYYEKNLRDMFYTSYTELPTLLYNFNEEYRTAKTNVDFDRSISRVSAGVICCFIFYVLIPLLKLYDSTLFEAIFDVGRCNHKNGYKEKKYKVLIRAAVIVILPIIGLVLFDKYSIVLLIAAPLFLNYMIMLFSSEGREMAEFFTFSMSFKMSESEIYSSKGEEIVYSRKEENMIVNDKEFLEKLENSDEINLNVSRDEELKSRK